MNPSLERATDRMFDAVLYANELMHRELVKRGFPNAPAQFFTLSRNREYFEAVKSVDEQFAKKLL